MDKPVLERIGEKADRRTQLAADRTVLAGERTYAASMRTGLRRWPAEWARAHCCPACLAIG